MELFRKLKNRTILLVDDDEWIRDSLSIYFETEDYRISAHETAEKALVELERRKFDVVITDYRLPGMDGIVFLEKIKKSHAGAIKIMISAYATEAVTRRAKQAGAQYLIPKPFTSKSIMACLNRLTTDESIDLR